MAGVNKYQGLSEGYLGKAGSAFGSLEDAEAPAWGQAGVGRGMTDTTGGFATPDAVGKVNVASTWKPDYSSEAGVSAAQAAEQGRETMQRGLSRMGINPNSGRFAGLNQEYNLAAAAAKAGAKSKATREENQDWIRNLLSAAGIGLSNATAAASGAQYAQSRQDALAAQEASRAAQAAQGYGGLAREYGDIAADAATADAMQADSLQEKVDELFGSQRSNVAPYKPIVPGVY